MAKNDVREQPAPNLCTCDVCTLSEALAALASTQPNARVRINAYARLVAGEIALQREGGHPQQTGRMIEVFGQLVREEYENFFAPSETTVVEAPDAS